MDNYTDTQLISGVKCDVKSCKYHDTADNCYANTITVESENAQRKAETFCGTFIPRS